MADRPATEHGFSSEGATAEMLVDQEPSPAPAFGASPPQHLTVTSEGTFKPTLHPPEKVEVTDVVVRPPPPRGWAHGSRLLLIVTLPMIAIIIGLGLLLRHPTDPTTDPSDRVIAGSGNVAMKVPEAVVVDGDIAMGGDTERPPAKPAQPAKRPKHVRDDARVATTATLAGDRSEHILSPLSDDDREAMTLPRRVDPKSAEPTCLLDGSGGSINVLRGLVSLSFYGGAPEVLVLEPGGTVLPEEGRMLSLRAPAIVKCSLLVGETAHPCQMESIELAPHTAQGVRLGESWRLELLCQPLDAAPTNAAP